MDRLKQAVCRSRDALAVWQSEIGETMQEAGVNVDDVHCMGPEQEQAELRRRLPDKYVQFQILGAVTQGKKANCSDGPYDGQSMVRRAEV